MVQEISGLTTAAVGALGAIVGAGVSAVIILVNGWRQRKHEKNLAEQKNRIQIREKIRETALNIALKEWEAHLSMSKNTGYTVSSPDAYIFRYHQILILMEENKLSPDAIAKIQLDTIDVSNATQDALEKYRRDNGLPPP
ncbi:MgtC/SapB family protein [Enterobacter asburiae]|uniref:hypothetical protein n=1 Tax=Enterobacter asburiae TaxID=61645 RepID=UPI0029666F69|nr:hypothetical protein [Enterobacter asburiae]MDW3571420.1 MgtC/SapB family protein [Enterobacter asburiae]